MIDSSTINILVNSALIGVNMFFCKKWIDRIDIDKKSMDEKIEKLDLKAASAAKEACEKVKILQTAHHNCRETLSDRFSNREETSGLFDTVFSELKQQNKEIYSLVGKRAGDHE